MQAIRQVLGGQIYVSERTSARIVEIFSGQSACGTQSSVAQLSDREFEIFQLIGEGLSASEIGDRLNISAKTVEAHRVNIKTKLKVATAAELISYAARCPHRSRPAAICAALRNFRMQLRSRRDRVATSAR